MSNTDPIRPRLIDVARKANVSISTASRALGRGSELLGAQTRDRVRQVAREMGYRVNPVARSLRLATTGQIGMIVPSISNPFFMELVVHVEHCLAERNLSLLLCDSRMSVSNEDYLLRSFESGAVDGLIFVPCHETYSTPALERASSHVPTVQLDRAAQVPGVSMVGVDDRHGIRAVLDHLRHQGAHELVMLTNTGSDVSSVRRVSEARIAAEEFNMTLADSDVIECNFSVDSAAAAIRALVENGRRPDAIVCLNDLLAIGAITELRRQSFAIPQDVMVTGFDDIQFAQLMRPSITTLHQPLEKIAAEGVDILMNSQVHQASEDPVSTRITFAGELMIRGSTVSSSPAV